MAIGNKVGLFIIRIYVGVTFLLAGIGKIWPGFDFSKFSEGWLKTEGLKGELAAEVGSIRPGLSFYRSLVENTFIPNASILTYIVVFGGMLVGIALIVGLLTRIASALGIVIAAAIFLLTWEAGFLPWTMLSNTAFVTGLLCLVTLLSGSGLIGGIDGKIRNRV